ncbi:unnamed protein product [Didymodactylos carnosus]|uniref:Uncharacterized protein n=1 Tax=Didymodactylos carnosus TaxID=1234261 RepID=A0A815W677_9BILA|nr:unnamed protein product [Didymodactylos carnosus]CAF1539159.1 unnamed protein product [Didymodactylos carnosus]CAF4215213.1 unnamed protein product [Didymodactylos carnosus]CAF4399348.1 unnamed protein product [Didymodactylos carnosus]
MTKMAGGLSKILPFNTKLRALFFDKYPSIPPPSQHQLLSVNLIAPAKRHLNFFDDVRQTTIGQDPLDTFDATGDYVTYMDKFWGDVSIFKPGIRISYIWLVHMLNPHSYRNDFLNSFGFVPYTPKRKLVRTSRKKSLNPSIDLVAAAQRQRLFVDNKVPLLRKQVFVNDEDFVRAQDDYVKFLRLIRLKKPEICVPTLEIDLIWHTHMQCPHSYYLDTQRICGFFLNHNDNLPDSQLRSGLESTRKAWKEEYNEEYPRKCRRSNDQGDGCSGGSSSNSLREQPPSENDYVGTDFSGDMLVIRENVQEMELIMSSCSNAWSGRVAKTSVDDNEINGKNGSCGTMTESVAASCGNCSSGCGGGGGGCGGCGG